MQTLSLIPVCHVLSKVVKSVQKMKEIRLIVSLVMENITCLPQVSALPVEMIILIASSVPNQLFATDVTLVIIRIAPGASSAQRQ